MEEPEPLQVFKPAGQTYLQLYTVFCNLEAQYLTYDNRQVWRHDTNWVLARAADYQPAMRQPWVRKDKRGRTKIEVPLFLITRLRQYVIAYARTLPDDSARAVLLLCGNYILTLSRDGEVLLEIPCTDNCPPDWRPPPSSHRWYSAGDLPLLKPKPA